MKKIKVNIKLNIGEKFTKDLTSYKVIVIGRYGVGKTTIIHKLMSKDNIDQEYTPTMSIDIKNFQVKVNNEIKQINIWDCCGNDKYTQNIPNLYKNVSIAIIVYAINDKKSCDELEIWYNMLKEYSKGSIIFLIGNKNDLENERKVTIEEGEGFKNSYDDIKKFFEASALKDKNMDKLLENIAISIYEKESKEKEEDNSIRKTITLVKEDFTKKGKEKKKKCC